MMKHLSRIAMLAAASVLVFAIPSRAEDVAALYKTKCAVCHGPDGKGDTAAGKKLGVKDFHSPEIAKAKDAELIEATTKGKGKMPSYDKKLTDDQIKELIKYIRTLK
ncbi:MAG TPA: cytochrome c [Alphaproteobacteria bacterium]|nr:cytochrome c [Alphaproteobacteria bacterium]